MAGRPPFDQWDAESEDIESFLEVLQEYFTTYDIADDEISWNMWVYEWTVKW